MPICNHCKRDYHICFFCAEDDWDWIYCSVKCYKLANPDAPETFQEKMERLNRNRKVRAAKTVKFEEPTEDQKEWNRLLFEFFR